MANLFKRTVSMGLVTTMGLALYFGFSHWNSIRIYPPNTRRELRAALKAALDGRSGDAERSFHEALHSCSQLTGESSEATISIMIKLADFYRERNRMDRAASIYEALIRMARMPLCKIHNEKILQLQKVLADACLELGRLERAEELYQSTLNGLGIDGEVNAVGPVYEGIGALRFKQNDFLRAIQAYERALEYCEKGQGKNSLQYLTLLNNIASCYFSQQTPESIAKAIKVAKEALPIAKKIGKQPEVARLVENLQRVIEGSH